MNANEVADGIESCTTDLLHYKAAAMLRQQQAEIEALKIQFDNLYEICNQGDKELTDDETESFEFWSPTTGWDSIPIPANKKLSGRDLQRWRQEAWRRLDDDYKQDPEGAFVMGFDAGIAILRKASEK